MIRAVVDANVLASGSLTALTPPGQILDLWEAGQFELIVSEHLLDEVDHTLDKPYFLSRLPPEQSARFRSLLRRSATFTPITVQVSGVATQPEDDLVLATAVSAQAEYLVTGDGPFRRRVPSYQGIRLVSPREFLEILRPEDEIA